MYGYIYKTTNLVNGKIYIGKKKGEFTDSYKGSGRYIRNAFNKYGFDNFSVELIEYCETLDIQNQREQYWIKHYHDLGYTMYNISTGGDGGDTYWQLSESDRQARLKKASESSWFNHQPRECHIKAWNTRRKNGTDKFSIEQRQKLSKSHLGKKRSAESIQKGLITRCGYRHSEETKLKIRQSNLGKTRSAETCERISEAASKRVGELNAFYGKHHSEETRKLISEKCKDAVRGKKWMTNGTDSIRVNQEDIEMYISQGYKLGRGKLKNGG